MIAYVMLTKDVDQISFNYQYNYLIKLESTCLVSEAKSVHRALEYGGSQTPFTDAILE